MIPISHALLKNMSSNTKIEWTDSTVNFWSGCTKVSAGCAHCYAEARDRRQMQEKVSHWGPGAPRLKHKGAVASALALNRKPWICDACGAASAASKDGNDPYCRVCGDIEPSFHRRRIFSNSLGDWLDDEVPIEWMAEMLDTIRQCDQVTWILCTKRPELAMSRLSKALDLVAAQEELNEPFYNWIWAWVKEAKPPGNIILLASVENQEAAEKRIPELLNIPANCRGLSLEPLLGPVDLNKIGYYKGESLSCLVELVGYVERPAIDWLIIGGESGLDARGCDVEWIRSLVEQGKAAGVATFVKQLGAKPYQSAEHVGGTGFNLALKDSKGGNMSEWPEGLRVQKWPGGF